MVTSASISTSNSASVTQKAVCPVGKKAIGGGYNETNGNNIHVVTTGPTTTNSANDSWQVKADRLQNGNATYSVTAICVSAL